MDPELPAPAQSDPSRLRNAGLIAPATAGLRSLKGSTARSLDQLPGTPPRRECERSEPSIACRNDDPIGSLSAQPVGRREGILAARFGRLAASRLSVSGRLVRIGSWPERRAEPREWAELGRGYDEEAHS